MVIFDMGLCHIFHSILIVILLAALPASGFYFIFLYFPQYIHQYWHAKLSLGLSLNTLLLLLMIPAMVFFGYLSDFVGKKKIILTAALGFLLLSYPIMNFVASGVWESFILGQLFFTLIETLYEGPFPGFMVELTAFKMRYTVIALGYNIGTAIFGGAAPLVSALLVHWRNNHVAPAFYLMAMALLSLIALALEYKRQMKVGNVNVAEK